MAIFLINNLTALPYNVCADNRVVTREDLAYNSEISSFDRKCILVRIPRRDC